MATKRGATKNKKSVKEVRTSAANTRRVADGGKAKNTSGRGAFSSEEDKRIGEKKKAAQTKRGVSKGDMTKKDTKGRGKPAKAMATKKKATALKKAQAKRKAGTIKGASSGRGAVGGSFSGPRTPLGKKRL